MKLTPFDDQSRETIGSMERMVDWLAELNIVERSVPRNNIFRELYRNQLIKLRAETTTTTTTANDGDWIE